MDGLLKNLKLLEELLLIVQISVVLIPITPLNFSNMVFFHSYDLITFFIMIFEV